MRTYLREIYDVSSSECSCWSSYEKYGHAEREEEGRVSRHDCVSRSIDRAQLCARLRSKRVVLIPDQFKIRDSKMLRSSLRKVKELRSSPLKKES